MALKSTKWLKLFETFIGDIRIQSKEALSPDGRGSPLKLWESQRRYLREVGSGLDNGIHSFNCLKSRQQGATTVSLAIDVFWLAMHPGIRGCVVTDDEKKRDENRGLIVSYVDSFPEGYFGDHFAIKRGGNSRTRLEFTNGSRLAFLVAGTRDKGTSWAEGSGYALMHACLAEGTPVILEHGVVKPIQDVQVGDKVLTHTGAAATVVDVCGQINTKGPMLKITPWLGAPIFCTEEHTIPTQRGVIEAKDVRRDDYLMMPVRRIEKKYWLDFLPETSVVAHANTKRAGWVRLESAGSGMNIELNEELGFALGYYLAEGHLILGPNRKPCGITFARHNDEAAYSDRAIRAFCRYTTGSVKTADRPGTKATAVTIYGTSLACWIDVNFGRVADKVIPDDVFLFGKDFCRGLLAGLLCGDGSKSVRYVGASNEKSKLSTGDRKYPINQVVLPTIRSSLAMQARDIAASLGYGWGAMRYEPAAEKHGRMCKEQWRVTWHGAGAGKLRELMGLEVFPTTGKKSEKCEIGAGQVFIKIRSIEHGFEEPMMWDISVDHDDHTFRTPSFAVGNTEVANYGSPAGFKSLEEGLAQNNPHRLFMRESTAKGYNHWHTRWSVGLNDITERSFFIGWWANDENRVERKDPRYIEFGLHPPTNEERDLIEQVRAQYAWKITPEQLAWIRWKQAKAGSEQGLLEENQPWVPSQAFQLTGYSFFPIRQVSRELEALINNQPVFKGYRYENSGDFFSFRMIALDPDVDDVEDVELKVWEEPVEGGKYVIGFDPAYGRSPNGDGNAIEVFRCYADRMVQVAEYRTREVDIKYASWVCFHLGAAYKDAMVNVEINGPGSLVMTEFDHLRQLLASELRGQQVKDRGWEDAGSQVRWFLYHRADSFGGGYQANYQASFRTRQIMLYGMKGEYDAGHITIRSQAMLLEMRNVVVVDDHIGAPDNPDDDKKDDRVFALGLAVLCWTNWLRAEMIQGGLTYEFVTEQERVDKRPDERRVNSLVSRFLARADEEPEPEADWREGFGL